MTQQDIQALLDRYWEGEASLEEERALKAYFEAGPVDERFAAEAPFFQALREERAVQAPAVARQAPMPQMYSTARRWASAAAVVGLVAAAGWWLARPDVAAPDVAAVQQPSASPVQQTVAPAVQSPLAQPAPSAARPSVPSPAAVAQHKPRVRRVNAAPPPSPAPEALDAETRKALEEVRAALALVSAKLNKGRRAATKNLQQVETLDKFFKHKKESEG